MIRTATELRTGRGEALPVIEHQAGPGPVVAVTANLHGDELGGIGVVHALDRWLPGQQGRGTVVLYPSLNPLGLREGRREWPGGPDLNRLFPGRPRGSRPERHADAIWTDLVQRQVDVVIDLHADSSRSIPYAIVDRALGADTADLRARIEAAAEATGLTVIDEYPDAQYRRYSLDRSLAGAWVNRRGETAVTIEAGPIGWLSPEAVTTGLAAVRNVLDHLGMFPSERVVHSSRVVGRRWHRASAPPTRHAGVFRAVHLPGSAFDRGEVLGEIVDVDGTVLSTVDAPARGLVVSWVETGWTSAGTCPGTLGLEE